MGISKRVRRTVKISAAFLFFFFNVAVLFTNCDQNLSGNKQLRSSVIIQIPESIAKNQSTKNLGKSIPLAQFAQDQKVCYGVMITAADIEAESKVCEQPLGLLGGFVEPGGTLKLSVPRGLGRKFELFAIRQDPSLACPDMKTAFAGDQLKNIYSLGVTESVDLKQAKETVRLTASLPADLTANVVKTHAFATSCGDEADSEIKQISSGGGMHTCLLTSKGAVYCWGSNAQGQLGDGTTAFRSSPTRIDPAVRYQQISVGYNHTCGLTSDYKIRCWGANTEGQIGNGSSEGSLPSPVDVDSANTYTHVYAGHGRSCGLRKDKDNEPGFLAVCWGANPNWAMLGAEKPTSVPTPTPVITDTRFAQIAINGYHSCGILANDQSVAGPLKCWGYNYNGQVGDPAAFAEVDPKASNLRSPAVVDSGRPYKQITNGYYHTCGITEVDEVRCWGSSTYGQLGNGSGAEANKTAPFAIDVGIKYLQITASAYQTCGITSEGVLKCWGRNNEGQMGNGSQLGFTRPTVVDAGTTYQQVVSGFRHVCGLTTGKTLKCWGDNSVGMLGDGATNTKTSPANFDLGYEFTDIAIGQSHTCGILKDSDVIPDGAGEVMCWGLNGFGQVGSGNTQNTGPILIDQGTQYRQLVAGPSHTCGLTKENKVKCWGRDYQGQLGNGVAKGDQLTPADIDDPTTTYSQIASGAHTVCGLTNEQKIKCWGWNRYGTVGDSTMKGASSPTFIVSENLYQKVEVFDTAACGLTTAGQIFCWGNNRPSPTLVDDPETIYTDLFVGGVNFCGLTSNGAVKCWGDNSLGQLLGFAGKSSSVPTALSLGDGIAFKSLSLGINFICGLRGAGQNPAHEGSLYCWGYNGLGAVGDGTTSQSKGLTLIDEGTKYSKVISGYDRSYGLTIEGKWKYWGSGEVFQANGPQGIVPWLPHLISLSQK